MSELKTPAADAPAEEWGALAERIPGAPECWSDLLVDWLTVSLPRAVTGTAAGVDRHDAPGAVCADGTWWSSGADGMYLNIDHPATAGCLLALLGLYVNVIVREHTTVVRILPDDPPPDEPKGESTRGSGVTLGRACIAAAAALGRWPGGAS